MKNPLPEKLELKLLSVLGYISTVFSLYLAFRFLWEVVNVCGQFFTTSLVFGLANLGIAISLFFAVWGLRHRQHLKHAFLTFSLIVVITFIQLYVAIYVSLGSGATCAV